MRLSKKVFYITCISFLSFTFASASITEGTITSETEHVWGENIGWIDFGSVAGNVTITDSSLSGYAYGENVGWISLSTVSNDTEGNLSGYAWGENIGWVDFSNVSINSSGQFEGSAYGENVGWIVFDNSIATDWRPLSVRPDDTPEEEESEEEVEQSSRRSSTRRAMTPVLQTVRNPLVIALTSPVQEDLFFGKSTESVRTLQQFLNSTGFTVSSTGGGSVGNETIYFGPATRAALIRFQSAKGIVPAFGYFGPLTRAYINANY